MTRTPAEVGAGLAQARPTRAIRIGERIHVLGIAGAGASAAAIHALAHGAIVTGCDSGGPSPYTAAVQALGIPIAWSHHPGHITDGPPPDRLAVTKALTAIAPNNPELRAAANRGIPAEPWQQVVADAAHGRSLVAVAGTHGKSTTAGWLTWVLAEAGLDPSAFVGALLPAALGRGLAATARVGQGATFVVEADEYAGNFDAYRPAVVVLTSIEWDHPDVFADEGAVIDAFDRWLDRVPAATVIANLDDPGVVRLLSTWHAATSRSGPIVGVSLGGRRDGPIGGSADSDLWIDWRLTGEIVERNQSGIVLDIDGLTPLPQRVHLATAGDHNASNALLALAAASGEDPGPRESVDRLLSALASFPGIGRRLERKGEARGVVVYDDYGHHPTAIAATIGALRQREPGRRIWAVYEPLTFHRTAAMLGGFADSLGQADGVAIADIWAGRDLDTQSTSSAALAAAVRAGRPGIIAVAPGSVEATAAWLAGKVEEGDVVLVMGGGRSYRIAEILLEQLEAGSVS